MLTLNSNENQSKCFKFIGADSSQKHTTHLISKNTSLIAPSNESGLDTCSFWSGYSDEAIVAFGESTESCGSIAYSGSSEGSFASVSSGSCFSAASSCGSFSGGGCSYSC